MLAIVRRGWIKILVTALLGLAVGMVALTMIPKEYEARTEVLVRTTGGATPDQFLSGSTLAQQMAKVYAGAVTTPLLLGPVARRLAFPDGEAALERRVLADVALESVVISVTVRDTDPQRAQAVAAAIALELDRVRPQLEGRRSPSVGFTVVRPATVPREPATPNGRLVLVVSLVGGLFLGCVLAMATERIEQRRAVAGGGGATAPVGSSGCVTEVE